MVLGSLKFGQTLDLQASIQSIAAISLFMAGFLSRMLFECDLLRWISSRPAVFIYLSVLVVLSVMPLIPFTEHFLVLGVLCLFN